MKREMAHLSQWNGSRSGSLRRLTAARVKIQSTLSAMNATTYSLAAATVQGETAIVLE